MQIKLAHRTCPVDLAMAQIGLPVWLCNTSTLTVAVAPKACKPAWLCMPVQSRCGRSVVEIHAHAKLTVQLRVASQQCTQASQCALDSQTYEPVN
jgi:hypothetical protein